MGDEILDQDQDLDWYFKKINQMIEEAENQERDGCPPHYARLIFEPATIASAQGLSFNLGAALKYILRAGHKEGISYEDDLIKAKRHLEMELEVVDRQLRVKRGEDPHEVWKVRL